MPRTSVRRYFAHVRGELSAVEYIASCVVIHVYQIEDCLRIPPQCSPRVQLIPLIRTPFVIAFHARAIRETFRVFGNRIVNVPLIDHDRALYYEIVAQIVRPAVQCRARSFARWRARFCIKLAKRELHASVLSDLTFDAIYARRWDFTTGLYGTIPLTNRQ